MDSTKVRGNLTELQCITSFAELGYTVSIPFGEDSRYDFIVDINDKLYKIQCKTSSEILNDNGEVTSISFRTVRQSGNRSKRKWRTKYLPNEVDYFATFYNGKCYLVSVDECSNEKTLRIMPSKNNQKSNINFIDDFELTEVVKKL